MNTTTTRWRVPPWAWIPIGLGIAAETVSNGLRAYGLGQHLEHFTAALAGVDVSLSGAVMALAALAVSLSQSRAWWVALTPGVARQRIVAGIIGTLLLAVSITAMSSHILEAQRAKDGGEAGHAAVYRRAEDAYKTAKAELDRLGSPRAVSVIQAEVSATKIDMAVWRRSAQCSDVTKADTAEACRPILDLYKERGAAARKAELQPEVDRLRRELGAMQAPKATASETESVVGSIWAWIMGLAVVMIATFGTVIFAKVEQVPAAAAPPRRDDDADEAPPSNSGGTTAKDDALADLRALIKAGHTPPSQQWLADRWGRTKGCVSKWLTEWDDAGELPGARHAIGRCKTVALETA